MVAFLSDENGGYLATRQLLRASLVNDCELQVETEKEAPTDLPPGWPPNEPSPPE